VDDLERYSFLVVDYSDGDELEKPGNNPRKTWLSPDKQKS